jgi:DNA (cytosine-5)-methyltransferase 1
MIELAIMKPTVGSLFAGIGGFELGFERQGFETVWQVEIDPFCRKVLAKHFPSAERFEDVRECGKHNLKPVDVICGGFPCQDISTAGRRDGIGGGRSGLWSEMARIIRELRPKFVLVENVAALLAPTTRDGWVEPAAISRVLGDLSEIGYDTEWQVISAADVGAPHRRERVWIVAYPRSVGCDNWRDYREGRYVLYNLYGNATESEQERHRWLRWSSEISKNVADTGHERIYERGIGVNVSGDVRFLRGIQSDGISSQSEAEKEVLGYSASVGQSGSRESRKRIGSQKNREGEADFFIPERFGDFWAVESNVGRVANGVPKRVDRLRGLGNAVVPQIPELIARKIKELL